MTFAKPLTAATIVLCGSLLFADEDLQRARDLLDQARRAVKPDQREKLTAKAEKHLEAAHKRTPKGEVSEAVELLGNIYVEQARMLKHQKEQAATKYQQAQKLFSQQRNTLKAALGQALPREKQNQLRMRYLQCQLLSAAVLEESGDVLPAEPRETALNAAAAEYDAIYAKYRTRLAGLYARCYQGRCYNKLKQHDKALKVWREILTLPDNPQPFRDLKTRVLAEIAAMHHERKQWSQLVEQCQPWLLKTNKADERILANTKMREYVKKAYVCLVKQGGENQSKYEEKWKALQKHWSNGS